MVLKMSKSDGCLVVVLAIIGIIALLFIEPLILTWLWNAVLVVLLPVLPVLTYWKAMGLMIICHILFGGTKISTSSKE
jgi:hypothetical protein